MDKSSSSSNKAFFLAVLMAVSVPSAAMAWDNEADPDQIVTVSVNMGSNDAGDIGGDGDGDAGCAGFSSMELSTTTLVARPERIKPGVSNPSIQQRLAALNETEEFQSLSLNDTFTHNNVTSRVLTRSSAVSTSWLINPDWLLSDNTERWDIARELTQMTLDESYDGEPLTISAQTPSLAMVDRRTYVTSPFTVSWDASSCQSDTSAWAEVKIERSELEALRTVEGTNQWTSVELEGNGNRYAAASMLALAADGEYRGEAYLLKPRLRSGGDGDRSTIKIADIPNDYDSGDVSISGESGTNTLWAVTKLYGELSQNAQLRTRYGFWMEVDPFGN